MEKAYILLLSYKDSGVLLNRVLETATVATVGRLKEVHR